MSGDATGSNPSQAHKETLSTIAKEKEALQGRQTELDAQQQALHQEEKEVEALASDLEGRIRVLAQEEAQLLERKKKLQDEARHVAERRTDITARRKQLARDRESLLSEDRRIDARRSKAEQELAYEEGLKKASIVRQPKPEQPEKGVEQRVHPRLAVEVEVSLHTEHNFYAGLTENLSEGGLFIATYEDLPVGTNMDVVLTLPDHPPIKAKGIVRWVREHSQFTEDVSPGVGVQFSGLSEDDRAAIERFIKAREPLFYETV
jgi:uncharacterized protein (TIGR02266 family)